MQGPFIGQRPELLAIFVARLVLESFFISEDD